MPTYQDLYAPAYTRTAADSRAVFGQVMGLVAVTVGFAAAGIYIARNTTGGVGILFWIAALVCLVGLHFAASRSQQLAIGLLFAFGLLLGMSAGYAVGHYAKTSPAVVWQAAGATAIFVATLGSIGYATRRDLSAWARPLFFALIALLLGGLVLLLLHIPHANVIYSVLGLVLFGAYTIFDFNRLRRAGEESIVPIAASIFLDIFNVFLFMLSLLSSDR